jgi:hypothetical protein
MEAELRTVTFDPKFPVEIPSKGVSMGTSELLGTVEDPEGRIDMKRNQPALLEASEEAAQAVTRALVPECDAEDIEERLARKIEGLQPELREVVRALFYQQKNVKDVARELKLARGTVYRRRAAAIEQLDEDLRPLVHERIRRHPKQYQPRLVSITLRDGSVVRGLTVEEARAFAAEMSA